ncbi:hypothetical protein [Spirosoma fluminis]
MNLPVFPLDAAARELVDFCLYFQTVAGFMAVYEDNLKEYDNQPGVAYEATETQYFQLFSRRRYADRESFFNAKAQFRRK